MAGEWHPSIDGVLAVLSDGKPKSYREIVEATGLSDNAVWSALKRCGLGGSSFETRSFSANRIGPSRGGLGVRRDLGSYHLYVEVSVERVLSRAKNSSIWRTYSLDACALHVSESI